MFLMGIRVPGLSKFLMGRPPHQTLSDYTANTGSVLRLETVNVTQDAKLVARTVADDKNEKRA